MMQTRTTRTLATPLGLAGLIAALGLGLGSCSSESGAASAEVTEEAGTDAMLEEMEPLPTEEELGAQAAEEINEENADAAFEDLKRQIESDG